MNILNFSYVEFEAFLLVFIRISSMLVLVPIFGSRSLPFQVKAALSLLLTFFIYPLLHVELVSYTNLFSLSFAGMKEIVVGMVIGYASRLMFAGIQLSGQLIGFEMGYAIVNILDPTTSSQVSVISEIEYIFTILIFLSMGAHYWVIRAMVESFELIPLSGVVLSGSLMRVLIDMSSNLFVIALKLAMPVVAAILFINVALGLIARTVPQMNVFIVGFPLQIGVGLTILSMGIPLFYSFIDNLFQGYGKMLFLMLRTMKG